MHNKHTQADRGVCSQSKWFALGCRWWRLLGVACVVFLAQAADRAEGAVLASTEMKLLASDGAANDQLGISVSVAGDVAVVGALGKSFGTNGLQGAAYVYERNAGGVSNWDQVKQLVASDGAGFDWFGCSVSVAGDVAVVGACVKNGPQGALYQGAAYVFERNAGGRENWGQVRKLLASDGAASEEFGQSVSVGGDVLAVAALATNGLPGVVYVFERDAGGDANWGEVKKLQAFEGAASVDHGFCPQRLSAAGDVLVVGAPLADSETGAAYVYERNAGGAENWGQVQRLHASDGAAGNWFGVSVSVAGDIAAVGMRGTNLQGAVYIYERNAGGTNNWGEVRKLVASDGGPADWFGRAVNVAGDMLVVGASSKGAAYVYVRNAGGANNWGVVRKLLASDGAAGDNFGCSVSVAGGAVVVGADQKNVSPWIELVGAAHIYTEVGGWNEPQWFGRYYDYGTGWLYHAEHGWMYWTGVPGYSIWLWSSARDWLWTGDTLYPFLWSETLHNWLWYYRPTGNGAGGWFYDYGNGQTEWR